MFARNITLDQVKEAIKDKTEFRIFERDGFVVVDYVITTATTFEHDDPELKMVLQELRGIAFSADGKTVISRPYHKFRNIGECAETQLSNIDFDKHHVVLHKEDGSMIRTIPVEGGFRLGTRAGITSVSMQAERFWVKSENYERYKAFFENMEMRDMTPIFEYVGPNNRIVLYYSEETLILTGLRYRHTGEYLEYPYMVTLAKEFKIPCVKPLFDSSENLLERVAVFKGLEGGVVRFDNGFMVKVKADDYVDKHRAVSQLQNEKDVLKLIFGNNLDDVLPILSDDVRKQVEDYRSKVVESSQLFAERLQEKYEAIMESLAGEIQEYEEFNEKMLRRDFALEVNANERYKRDSKFLFKMLDGKEVDIPEYVISKCGSQSGVDSIRHIIGQHKLWQIENADE